MDAFLYAPELWAAVFVVSATIAVLLFSNSDGKPPRNLKPLSSLPGPSGNFLLGNVQDITSLNVHRTLTKWTNQYGGLYRIRILNKTVLVLTDPALVTPLLASRTRGGLPKASFAYDGELLACS